MPCYSADRPPLCGFPLGGLGAGTIDLQPDGTFANATCLNNPDRPLGLPEQGGLLGFHAGLRVSGKQPFAALLQTAPLGTYPTMQRIAVDGRFPLARLTYEDERCPLQVHLEAWSALMPPPDGSLADWPACILEWHLHNSTKSPWDVALFFCGRNLIGPWNVGRVNRLHRGDGLWAILFEHQRPATPDLSMGSTALALAVPEGWTPTAHVAWNQQQRPFHWNADEVVLAPWEYFATHGRLENLFDEQEAFSENVELGGALAVSGRLAAGGSAVVTGYLAWHMPQHYAGHRYERRCATSREVVGQIHAVRRPHRARLDQWQQALQSAVEPSWLADALMNHLAPLVTSAWWDRDGRFALIESPRQCPLFGTLDVRFYGSLPLAILFPELELNELRQFAKAQRPDGYMPHDLGRLRFDLPSNGTTLPLWKDLNAKFILMVLRDWQWIGDRAWLEQMYPSAARAFEWLLASDRNGDGLPDCEGQDQTYDLWDLRGTTAYTGSLTLAACLAMESLAHAMRDARMEQRSRAALERGRDSFVAQLWTGRYFRAAHDGKTFVDACTLDQLCGQWYADLLGLEPIVEREQIKQAIQTIVQLNLSASPFGAVNSIRPDGTPDTTCQQSSNIWAGVCYGFASLAIYEGFRAEGLALARCVWEVFSRRLRRPWDQPDTLRATDGAYLFGDHYMRNMAIWGVPLALDGRPDAAGRLRDRLRGAPSALR